MAVECSRGLSGFPGAAAGVGAPAHSTSPPSPNPFLECEPRARSFSPSLPLTTSLPPNPALPWSLAGAQVSGHPLGGLRPPSVEDEDGNVLPRSSPSYSPRSNSPSRHHLAPAHHPTPLNPLLAAPSSPLPWGIHQLPPASTAPDRQTWHAGDACSKGGTPSISQTLQSALEESLQERQTAGLWHYAMAPPSHLDVNTYDAARPSTNAGPPSPTMLTAHPTSTLAPSSATAQPPVQYPSRSPFSSSTRGPSLHISPDQHMQPHSPGGSAFGSASSSRSDLEAECETGGKVPELSDEGEGSAGVGRASMARDMVGLEDSDEDASEDGCVPSLRLSRAVSGGGGASGHFEKKRIRRSLSSWYNGKSKSFTALSEATGGSVQGLRKPERWSAKRRRNVGLAARRSLVEEAENALAEERGRGLLGLGGNSLVKRRSHTMDNLMFTCERSLSSDFWDSDGLQYGRHTITITEDLPLSPCPPNVAEYADYD